jgi:erythromycin esterase-like protein
MSQDIRDFVTPSCALLALGEPTHGIEAFLQVRNELFGQLAGRGFRSIALETDRVAALIVNDFVQEGVGALDTVMNEGFSHEFGNLDANRHLIAWMREYNESRPLQDRLTFHGFDASTEMMNVPSPRRYLEYACDYLGLDLDVAGLAGDDERWSRTEAVMDPAASIGATAEADKLRAIADDMLISLYARAPEMIAATSRTEWSKAKTQLTAGLGLLRYHKLCAAQHLEQTVRWSRLSSTRDAIMAENLLDIRSDEARRGATLVFAHNRHLQRGQSDLRLGEMDIHFASAGAIVSSLSGEQYTFVAGSLGRSEALGVRDPEADTYEGLLQRDITTWGLAPAAAVTSGRTRTDVATQVYIPLDQATLDGAEAILHVGDGATTVTPVRI